MPYLSEIDKANEKSQLLENILFFSKLKFFFYLFLFIASLITCLDIDGIKNKKENKKKTDLFFLTIAQNRTKGNCLRKDSSTSTNYCDRRSSGLCNASDLILTNSEKTFNLNEANNLVKAVPSCNFSFLNSGIASESVASFTDEDTIKANNNYLIVESCESTGINSSATLVTEVEFLYIISPKGRIGIAADKTYNTSDTLLALSLGSLATAKQTKADALDCLTGGFPQSEKDLFADLRTGKKIKALTCSTKQGSTNSCP
jgi:hypothetical protein